MMSLTGCSGCGFGGGGKSEYETIVEGKKSAADALTAKGAKVEMKKYPQGEAYCIDLTGATIDDSVLELVEAAAPITELILNGSTITDAHATRINAEKIGSYLLKLDISKTAISDTGLAELKNLPLLMELDATGSKISKAAATSWQNARKQSSAVFFKNIKVKI
jgi:hypothetical protein